MHKPIGRGLGEPRKGLQLPPLGLSQELSQNILSADRECSGLRHGLWHGYCRGRWKEGLTGIHRRMVSRLLRLKLTQFRGEHKIFF